MKDYIFDEWVPNIYLMFLFGVVWGYAILRKSVDGNEALIFSLGLLLLCFSVAFSKRSISTDSKDGGMK